MDKLPRLKLCLAIGITLALAACQNLFDQPTQANKINQPQAINLAQEKVEDETTSKTSPPQNAPSPQHSYWLSALLMNSEERKDALEYLEAENTLEHTWKQALLLNHPAAKMSDLKIAEEQLQALLSQSLENGEELTQLYTAALRLNQYWQQQLQAIRQHANKLEAVQSQLDQQQATNQQLSEKIRALTTIEERMNLADEPDSEDAP